MVRASLDTVCAGKNKNQVETSYMYSKCKNYAVSGFTKCRPYVLKARLLLKSEGMPLY